MTRFKKVTNFDNNENTPQSSPRPTRRPKRRASKAAISSTTRRNTRRRRGKRVRKNLSSELMKRRSSRMTPIITGTASGDYRTGSMAPRRSILRHRNVNNNNRSQSSGFVNKLRKMCRSVFNIGSNNDCQRALSTQAFDLTQRASPVISAPYDSRKYRKIIVDNWKQIQPELQLRSESFIAAGLPPEEDNDYPMPPLDCSSRTSSIDIQDCEEVLNIVLESCSDTSSKSSDCVEIVATACTIDLSLEDSDSQLRSSSESTMHLNESSPLIERVEVQRAPPSSYNTYNIINENLERLISRAVDGQRSARNKWRTDHFYFVVDMYTLLWHPHLLTLLVNSHFLNTKGSMIYIPYCVIQKLSEMERGSDNEEIRKRCLSTIKLLNERFEAGDRNLQAQSAVEDSKSLIEINSFEDRLINCCLQLKDRIKHVILLAEDVSLRTQCIFNDLIVSNGADLLNKRL